MRAAYLVEDNPKIRRDLTVAMAELTQFNVVAYADTEADAVDWLKQHCGEAELVVLDIFLRKGTGLGVLSRRGDFSEDCHIVVLTNSATAHIRDRCKALGAHAVFDKSNELDAFFDYCRALPQLLQ